MLVQQMTRLVLQMPNGDKTTLIALQELEQTFNQNVIALRQRLVVFGSCIERVHLKLENVYFVFAGSVANVL